jgi:hypothetical protein
MDPLIVACSFAILTIIPLFLFWQVNLTKQTLRQTENARQQLETLLQFKSEHNNSSLLPQRMRLVVEISTPLELAKREQPLTKYLGKIAPELIVKKVYEQVSGEIFRGLQEKKVDAKITIETR